MRRIALRSYAKINWFLQIGRRRDDGFHELETIFQTISLADELEFSEARQFAIDCDDQRVPADRRNLVWRAWEALAARFDVPPVQVRLRKRIPAGGGLGGGSSNAATTLRALTSLFDLSVEAAELHELASSLGSDVPFFLVGGTAYASGRGERLEPLPDIPQQSLWLALPPTPVDTADCYRRLASMRGDGHAPRREFGIERAKEFAARPEGWWKGGELVNDLEAPAFELVPALAEVKRTLERTGAPFTLLSGSGSTLFAVASNQEAVPRGRFEAVQVTTVPRHEALALA